MRFGIWLISWILPKILRIRRVAGVRALVLAGVSIALVAMCHPALTGERKGSPRVVQIWRGSRLPLPYVRAVARYRPVSRQGQEKPRAHVTVRRSRYVLDLTDIGRFASFARGERPTPRFF